MSRKTVRCFLAKLQAQNMLQKGAQNSASRGPNRGRPSLVYTIVNFDKYQAPSTVRAQETAQNVAEKGPPINTVRNTVKQKDLTVFVAEPAQVDLEEAIATREVSDAQKVVELWNDLANKHGLTKARGLNDARRKSINARLKEAGGLQGVKDVIDYIGTQPVLLGKQKFSDGRTWKASFEYLVRPNKFLTNLEKAQAEKEKSASRRVREIRPEDLGT